MRPRFLLVLIVMTGAAVCWVPTLRGGSKTPALQLLPYPQEVKLPGRELKLGPAGWTSFGKPSATILVGQRSLERYLPRIGRSVAVRLGSVEEGYDPSWLTHDQSSFLARNETSPEASVLTITRHAITVVGKGKWGMLYGVQTVNQLAIQSAREKRQTIPCVEILDWPDAKWRCLAPQLAWYAGWGSRFEGYDNGNWSVSEWKWMVDWSLLHKCNAWAMCMYGKWPFTLPGYEADTLDFDSFFHDPGTGQKTPFHYTHRNIKHEFLPELIRYANARGVQVHAYIGKNTFNGTYLQRHPEAQAKSLVREAIPFTPGVHEYWDAFIGRIIELGFNGFVFEDPETYHVPNSNALCYTTFWEPWAKKYGFKSVAETDPNKPPLGVHLEYYTWLFRQFDQSIQKHAKALGRPEPAIYLISHILLNRIMKESADREERARWFALIDQKHGRKVPFVLFEDNEKEYVNLLGGNRAATLGGRGGAAAGCFRIANINNDRMHGDLGMDLAEERDKQRRMIEAGGFGSMAYIFQWTNTEVFGYLGAQYLWRHDGVPGINNQDDFGFLDYAYRICYGDDVGALVARAYSVNSCVCENHVLEDDPGTIFFGGPLHRDFQLLAVLADEADRLSQAAYRMYAGREPDLFKPDYDPDTFRWEGYDPSADTLFKTERLRLLCVSSRRARELCTTALASRKAKQLTAEGASVGDVCAQFDLAVKAARTSELLYFANYEDDYRTGDDGTRLRKKLEALRTQFLASCDGIPGAEADGKQPVPQSVRDATKRRYVIDWEKQTDALPERPGADKPGLYLSTDIGLAGTIDYYCLGAVFTVQARGDDRAWHTIFRRALLKKDAGWQHWDIPLDAVVDQSGAVTLRLITDAYSRAIDRDAPSWKWGYWGRPQIVQVTASGKREVRYDFIEHLDRAKLLVQLDSTGKTRGFDGNGLDSSGARFQRAETLTEQPAPAEPAISAFAPHGKGNSGLTIGEFLVPVPAGSNLGDSGKSLLPHLP
jgi:hypothetical protein